MLTIEQVNNIIEEAVRMADAYAGEFCINKKEEAVVDVHKTNLEGLKLFFRECLEAGTFNDGIEAAADYHIGCQKEQLAAFNNGASLNNTAIRLEAHKTSADAIHQLKRTS